MSKVSTSSHEYPHAEKIENLLNRISKVRPANNNKQLGSGDTQQSNFSS